MSAPAPPDTINRTPHMPALDARDLDWLITQYIGKFADWRSGAKRWRFILAGGAPFSLARPNPLLLGYAGVPTFEPSAWVGAIAFGASRSKYTKSRGSHSNTLQRVSSLSRVQLALPAIA